MVFIISRLSLVKSLPPNKASENFVKSVGVEIIAPAPNGTLKSVSGSTFQVPANLYDLDSLLLGLILPKT